MKKQVSVIVMVIAVAQMVFAAGNIKMIDIEQKLAAKNIAKSAFIGKNPDQILKQSGTHINAFAKSVGSSPELVAQNLSRKPELVEAYMYVDMVKSDSNATAVDKRNAENGAVILSSFGIAKGVNAADMAAAKLESPSVTKFVELIPRLATYGDKAVQMGDVFAMEVKAGLSKNKALRSAARRVLGLEGAALDKFMRDPVEGLGNCNKVI